EASEGTRVIPTKAKRAVRSGLLIVMVALSALLVVGVASAGASVSSRGGHLGSALTDAQKQCLASHGVTFPTGGQHLTPEQRQTLQQQLEAAAKACGITLPTHGTTRTA